jgi:hypothetical protein
MRAVLSAVEMLTVPGVLDGALPPEVMAELPEATPPAPWRSHLETALWGFRSTPESAGALPAGLEASLPIGAGAFVSYLDGAVSAYHEVLATPRCVKAGGVRGYVPFIAVDSVASIHGGRTNWALPKVLAAFTGAPARDTRLTGAGSDWSVSAEVQPRGPWFPFRGGAGCAQPWPDGSTRVFRSAFRGRARLASLTVEVSGPDSLTSVLPSGRHLGLLIRGSVAVGAPR